MKYLCFCKSNMPLFIHTSAQKVAAGVGYNSHSDTQMCFSDINPYKQYITCGDYETPSMIIQSTPQHYVNTVDSYKYMTWLLKNY